MAETLQPARGAARIADALLHSSRSGAVLLRVPSQALSGNDAEQLGLAVPQFQDLPLAPAVWRQRAKAIQLWLSATAVRSALTTLGVASAEALFTTAVGIVVDGVVCEIVSFETREAKGEPFCYRITVHKPQT